MKSLDNNNKIFAENVRRRRKELKMTQEDLAEKSGLHRTYIGGIEQFNRNPSLKSMQRIANALKIDLAILTSEALTTWYTKYTLCINEDGNFNFYPIEEEKLSKDQIDFLENITSQ